MNRENQFFDIGVQGRKTGVSVPHQELDAFGLENPDGFFSPSPEKASQPLDAFLTRTQRGSDVAAAVGSPAPAGRGMGEGAMSGSGEESMDIDSGVDGEFYLFSGESVLGLSGTVVWGLRVGGWCYRPSRWNRHGGLG